MLAEAIADFLGIQVQHGTEWTIMCPSPDHSDRRPSASIYVGEPMEREKGGKLFWRLPGMWVCYSCGARGRVTSKGIEEYEPTADMNLDQAEALLTEMEARRQGHYPEAWLDLFDYYDGIHPYWLDRFLPETCWRHRLGYDFDTECVTYPLRNTEGKVMGIVRRDLTGERPWKYKYPSGTDVGQYLYGYAEAVANSSEVIVLTEGAMDAVAVEESCHEMTDPGVYSGLAIYGSLLRPAQEHLIRRLYPNLIVTAFDNDDAGQKAHESVVAALGVEFEIVKAVFPGKDIAELTISDRFKVISDATAS
jgi:hypothetical protein